VHQVRAMPHSLPVYNLLRFEGGLSARAVQLIKKILEGKTELSENLSEPPFYLSALRDLHRQLPSRAENGPPHEGHALWNPKNGLPPTGRRGVLGNFLRDKRRPPFLPFLRAQPGKNLLSSKEGGSAILPDSETSPARFQTPAAAQVPEVNPAAEPGETVLYFTGCATNYFFPNVGHSVIKLLNRMEWRSSSPGGQMCCGLPPLPGRGPKEGLEEYPGKPDALPPERCGHSRCGLRRLRAALKKEYAHILQEMGEDAKPAKELARKVVDISRVLVRSEPGKKG